MRALLDLAVYASVRGLFFSLGLLPQPLRVAFFTLLFRLAFLIMPKLGRISLRNLEIAFPERDLAWRREILSKSKTEMARLLSDMVRLPKLSESWAREHVSCDFLPRYAELLSGSGGKGILIATGHLGSFELLGHAIGLFGMPLSAIARKFRSPQLDRWWTSLREARGNSIIDRRGAFKAMVADVSAGRSVAVLFDQNVTRNHAVFPTWFGVPAATTRALALAAIKTEAPVVVASIRYCGADHYSIEACECETADIYQDETLSSDERVLRLTQRLSDHYCEMIRRFPEGWFWLHRRWKTRPEGGEESVYS
jgi:KDO2-lipid IV(A) lauroyltransferase